MAEKAFPFGEKIVTHEDLPYEFMMNVLRLHRGFSIKLFEERTGLSFTKIAHIIQTCCDHGLLEKGDRQNYYPTEIGRRFLNDLLQYFLLTSKL